VSYVLAIGIPVALLIGGLAAIMLRDRRDDDPAPFNWQGTVPAAPGQCSCGAPHARKLTPFPPATAPALPEMIAAPVATSPGVPAYVRDELNGHDNADDFLESRWRKIDGERLAEQIRDGAL
jgi:hypothetical protein